MLSSNQKVCLDIQDIPRSINAVKLQRNQEKYKCYPTLSEDLVEGIDYRRSFRQLNSPLALVAIHGGNIEPGTSEIVKVLAADNFSYYSFESLRPESDQSLHITSSKFNDPKCLEICCNSYYVISIHGCLGEYPGIFIGGRDTIGRKQLVHQFKNSGLLAMKDRIFPGLHKSNPCNLGKFGIGLQLEVTRKIREDIVNTSPSEQVDAFFRVVSQYIQQFNNSNIFRH